MSGSNASSARAWRTAPSSLGSFNLSRSGRSTTPGWSETTCLRRAADLGLIRFALNPEHHRPACGGVYAIQPAAPESWCRVCRLAAGGLFLDVGCLRTGVLVSFCPALLEF